MIIGIGCDIVQIARIESVCQKKEESFLNYICADTEKEAYYQMPPQKRSAFLAKRFAVKEALAKALGTGIGAKASWKDIRVTHTAAGVPQVVLSGRALQTIEEKTAGKAYHIHLSISDDVNALAFVVIECL